MHDDANITAFSNHFLKEIVNLKFKTYSNIFKNKVIFNRKPILIWSLRATNLKDSILKAISFLAFPFRPLV